MTKLFRQLSLSILVVMAFSNLATAQPTLPSPFGNPASAQQGQAEKVPLKMQIVISKYQGDRKTSSLPYTLLVTANGDHASLAANANVPIPGSTNAGSTYSYTNVGTNIDCTVTTDSGRFKVALNLRENFPFTAQTALTSPNAKFADAPIFNSFSYTGSVSMKEGETKQIISSSDRTTGEVEKIDITLTLDK
jgi:hypothetical protein